MKTYVPIAQPIKAFQVTRETVAAPASELLRPHDNGKSLWFKTHQRTEEIAHVTDWVIFSPAGSIFKMKDETFRKRYRSGQHAIPDHEVALLASDLTALAKEFCKHQSLRQRISSLLTKTLTLKYQK